MKTLPRQRIVLLIFLLAIAFKGFSHDFTIPKIYQYSSFSKSESINSIKKLSVSKWKIVDSPSFGREGVYGWVRFEVKNLSQVPQYLEVVGHFKENVSIWIYEQDSLLFTNTLITRDQRKANPILHRYFLYDLPHKKHITVYLRAYNFPGDALKFPIRIWENQDFVDANQFDIWYWALFTGIMLMTILISIFNYLFHTQKIYLFYAGYILCFGIYALVNDGWGVLLPDSLGFLDELVAITHWINFGLYFFLLFSQKFLAIDLTVNSKWSLVRLNPIWGFMVMLVFLIAAHLAKSNNSPLYFDIFAKGGFLTILIYISIWISYVFDAVKRKFKPVWLHILSGSMMLIVNGIFYFLINSGWLKIAISEMGIFRIALIADVVVILISWLYRQRVIQESQELLEVENKAQQQAIYEQTIKELRHQTALQQQRESLARDLHDGIGSQLSHIIGQIDLMSLKDLNQPKLVLLGEFTRETNQALRDTIWVLNKESITWVEFKQRLTGYIARICNDLDSPLVSYSFHLPDAIQFSPLLTSSLFHIIQEALNNALKYAKADIIQLTIYHKDKNLMLFFEDNGKGFDAKNASTGYGLSNIRKRVEELGGNYTLESSSKGTNIKILIPYYLDNQ
jgi:signal transduction histidine kinase